MDEGRRHTNRRNERQLHPARSVAARTRIGRRSPAFAVLLPDQLHQPLILLPALRTVVVSPRFDLVGKQAQGTAHPAREPPAGLAVGPLAVWADVFNQTHTGQLGAGALDGSA